MEAAFWKQRWAENRIGFHRPDENPILTRHWGDLELSPTATVLVPLSGKSLDLWWLARQGHPVLGVELSPLAVEAFFGEAGLSPARSERGDFDVYESSGVTVWCGDFFDLKPEDVAPQSSLWDRAALIAMPPEMRPDYVAQTARLLAPGARGLLATLEYVDGEMAGPPFSVDEAEVRRLYATEFDVERLALGEPEATAERFAERGLRAMRDAVYRLERR